MPDSVSHLSVVSGECLPSLDTCLCIGKCASIRAFLSSFRERIVGFERLDVSTAFMVLVLYNKSSDID
jgi:hypothetical protein